MVKKAIGDLESAYNKLVINDQSGGLNTYSSGLNLKSNESPDMLNVIPFLGRLLFRGGWFLYSSIAAAADQCYAFYDSLGNKHLVVWAGGSLYDVITGVPTLIVAVAYTAGQRIGVVDLQGKLYWSTQTKVLQFWDPVAGTHGNVPQTGPDPPPKSPYLFLYTNAIVALGVQFGASAYQSTVMAWSIVNDPGNWNALNSQAVGPNNGASLQFGLVMGIAEVGVAPFRTFVIGRSDKGLLAYSGALGSLTETLISFPVGCADGASAQFAPSAEKFGTIIFMGTDGQFWSTNGVTAEAISTMKVQPTLSAAYADAISTPGNRFWSGYNEAYQYYFCTVAGQQYVYKWDLKAFTIFQGWPVGPSVNFTDITGLPQIYIAANTPLVVGGNSAFVVAEVGLAGADDNGTVPNVYYKTPWLHMGDPKKFKEYHWISPQFYAKGAIYQVSGQSLPRAADNSSMNTKPLLFSTPIGVNPFEFELDVSDLDGGDLLGGPGDAELVGTGNPVVSMGRLVCPVDTTGTILEGLPNLQEILKGSAAQFTVTLYPQSKVCDFELLGLEIFWLDRGYMRDAGNKYNPESGVPYGFPGYPPAFDPFIPPELQVVPQYDIRTTPAINSGYHISGGQVHSGTVAGEHVAFLLGGFDEAGPLPVYAFDNAGNSATLSQSIDDTINGPSGIAVDAANNVMYSQTGDSDGPETLFVQSRTVVPGASIPGAFAPPASIRYAGYSAVAPSYIPSSTVILNADRSIVYVLAANSAFDHWTVLKISTSTGAIIGTSATLIGAAAALLFTPDASKILVLYSDNSSFSGITVLDAITLTTIGSANNGSTDQVLQGNNFAISPDNSTACFCVTHFGTNATTAWVFNIGALTFTSFSLGTDLGNPVTFPKVDSAHVLIYSANNKTLTKYTLTGATSTVYDLSALSLGDTESLITEPSSGLIYGAGFPSVGSGYTLWVFDTNSSTILTNVTVGAGDPTANGPLSLCFAT